MRRLLILPNITKPEALACTALVVEKLVALGCQPLLQQEHFKLLPGCPAGFGNFPRLLEQCEGILAIGGDGTIIHALKHGVEAGKPVLGINAGRLGFLAEVEPDELEEKLNRLVLGSYRIEQRTVLRAAVDQNFVGYALNDVVLTKGEGHTLAEFEIACGGRFMDSFRADGIIFSTPMGSTAYSLSAGGPVVDPAIDAILLTPICPHALSVRPTLLSGRESIVTTSREPLALTLDGQPPLTLTPGQQLAVSKAVKPADFISFGEKEFFEVLSKKIRNRG